MKHKSDHKMSDEKLINAYLNGDTKSLSILIQRWHIRLLQQAHWITKDKDLSKDIVQDTWATIIRKLDTLRDKKMFGAWALKIVSRKSFDSINAKKYHLSLDTFQVSDTITNDKDAENEQRYEALIQCFSELSSQQQMVLKLFYIENYKLSQIARILAIPVGTVKSRLYTSREQLKLILKHKGYEK